jgi:hypothetical protein
MCEPDSVVASLAWVRPRLGVPVDGTKPAWRFNMPFAQAELRTAENLSNMPEKLEQSALPIPEMGGALRRLRIFGQRDKLKADRSKGA